MKVFVITPVFNRKKITLNFVKLLRHQVFQDFQLIIIDNGSDGTGQEVSKLIENATIITGNHNLWWASSLQLAINYIKSLGIDEEVYLHINNDDTEFNPHFLEKGIQTLEKNPKSFICARAISNLDPSNVDTGVFIDWSNLTFNKCHSISELNCTSTRGLFFRLQDFIDIGEFYPKLLPHYLSDYELTNRAHQRGYQLIVPENLELIYYEQETGDRSVKRLGITEIFPHMFSLKNAMNPYIFVKFILLRSPWRYKLSNILLVLYKTTKYIVRALLISLGVYKENKSSSFNR